MSVSELDVGRIRDLPDLNARLWAWVEGVYHHRAHSSLNKLSPLARYQQDLPRIRTLGAKAVTLDEIFYHWVSRKVGKTGLVSWVGLKFEVPFELVGKYVMLLIDPHSETAIHVESQEGDFLGAVIPLDATANNHRKRNKPEAVAATPQPAPPAANNMVEIALQQSNRPLEDKKDV